MVDPEDVGEISTVDVGVSAVDVTIVGIELDTVCVFNVVVGGLVVDVVGSVDDSIVVGCSIVVDSVVEGSVVVGSIVVRSIVVDSEVVGSKVVNSVLVSSIVVGSSVVLVIEDIAVVGFDDSVVLVSVIIVVEM